MALLRLVEAILVAVALAVIGSVHWLDTLPGWAVRRLQRARILRDDFAFEAFRLLAGTVSVLVAALFVKAALRIASGQKWLDPALAGALSYMTLAAYLWLLALAVYGYVYLKNSRIVGQVVVGFLCLVATAVEARALWDLYHWSITGGLFASAVLGGALSIALTVYRAYETFNRSEQVFLLAMWFTGVVSGAFALTACLEAGAWSVGGIGGILACLGAGALAVVAGGVPWLMNKVLDEVDYL